MSAATGALPVALAAARGVVFLPGSSWCEFDAAEGIGAAQSRVGGGLWHRCLMRRDASSDAERMAAGGRGQGGLPLSATGGPGMSKDFAVFAVFADVFLLGVGFGVKKATGKTAKTASERMRVFALSERSVDPERSRGEQGRTGKLRTPCLSS